MQKGKVKSSVEFMTWNRKIFNIDKLRNQKIDKIPKYKLVSENLLYRKGQNQ